jgi:hypothetical protein
VSFPGGEAWIDELERKNELDQQVLLRPDAQLA